MKKKNKDYLAEFDQPMKLIDDPAFKHATKDETGRDPLADFIIRKSLFQIMNQPQRELKLSNELNLDDQAQLG